MRQYLDMIAHIRANGKFKKDRTGVGCYSVFGYQLRFDLNDGFPVVTTKKLYLRGIIHELLWFLKGSTDNNLLVAENVHIWDEWAQKEPITRTVRMSETERLQAWADMEGRRYGEVHTELTDAWARSRGLRGSVERKEGDIDESNVVDFGHAFLDSKGVPRDRIEVLKPAGELGPIYGKQWRAWKGADGRIHDQIANAIELLKRDPASRRNVVSAWNVGELDEMHLNPCHALFQFYAEELTYIERVGIVIDGDEDSDQIIAFHSLTDNDLDHLDPDGPEYIEAVTKLMDEHSVPKYRLSCQLYQRSADSFLGVPFNIASYALLTHMVAQVCNMVVGDFVHSFGDLHVYQNHLEQVDLQMTREPKPLPRLKLNPAITNIDDFKFSDIEVVGYESWPAIKGAVAV